MNSRLQMKLDGKMTLLEMVQHCETCLTMVHRNEADDDAKALQSSPFTEPDASVLEINAKERFTPNVFKAKVQFSVEAAKKCSLIEILDDDDTIEYIVGRRDRDIMYYVKCELTEEANLKRISYSCRKLQSLGTPCSHIFFVLGLRDESKLPDYYVLERWTMGAKHAFPTIRKSTMYDYSPTLLRFSELHNLSLVVAFVASHSTEAYERTKRVLEQEAAVIMPNAGANEGKMYGSVRPQAPEVGCEEFRDVLDPMTVPDRGAPKKKLKSSSNKTKSTTNSSTKCSLYRGSSHNRRTCSLRPEIILSNVHQS
jgi:zinc finger SWIM domain-containing protein 3